MSYDVSASEWEEKRKERGEEKRKSKRRRRRKGGEKGGGFAKGPLMRFAGANAVDSRGEYRARK